MAWVPGRPKRLIWPRLAEAQGSLEHDLVLEGASGDGPAEV